VSLQKLVGRGGGLPCLLAALVCTRLGHVLALGATLFAGLETRHDELMAGLAELDAGRGPRPAGASSKCEADESSEGSENEYEEVAATMVEMALADLLDGEATIPTGIWAV